MRFETLLLAGLAGLAPSVVADWLETTWTCDVDLFVHCGPYNSPYSHFHTSQGSYYVESMSDGCHSTNVPGMTEFCIDWGNTRAHFKFAPQNQKRCLKKNPNGERFTGDSCTGLECWRDTWPEVPCSW